MMFGPMLPVGASAGDPSSFPALPSPIKSFQIVTNAVDNLSDPSPALVATEQ